MEAWILVIGDGVGLKTSFTKSESPLLWSFCSSPLPRDGTLDPWPLAGPGYARVCGTVLAGVAAQGLCHVPQALERLLTCGIRAAFASPR